MYSSPRALFQNIRHLFQNSILTECFLGSKLPFVTSCALLRFFGKLLEKYLAPKKHKQGDCKKGIHVRIQEIYQGVLIVHFPERKNK